MTAPAETAPADDNSGRTQLQSYTNAAARVVQTIAARDTTHGDPELFAQTFAIMLNAYLRPVVVSGRPLVDADVFVLLDLMKTCRIAVGGIHPDHFLDKAGYGVLGLVAADPVRALVNAKAPDPEPEPEEADANAKAPPPAPAPNPKPYVEPADTIAASKLPPAAVQALQAAYPAVEPEMAATDQDDDDADLLRWALDPASSPFADQLDSGQLRPGVTAGQVEVRRQHVMALLQAFAPTTQADVAARSKALATYGGPLPILAA